VGKRIRRPRGKGCEVPTPPTPPPPPPPNQPSMFNAHAAVDCSAHLTRFRYAKEKQTEEIKNVCVPSCQPPFLSIKKRERFPFCNFLPSRNFCLVFFFFFHALVDPQAPIYRLLSPPPAFILSYCLSTYNSSMKLQKVAGKKCMQG
jgi:hypothetical protein